MTNPAMQERDKPFILGETPAPPFVFVFRGQRYELPGDVPVSMVEKAVQSASAGQSDDLMAAGQVVSFLADVCPHELATALRSAGSPVLNKLFDAWSKHVDLGENLAS